MKPRSVKHRSVNQVEEHPEHDRRQRHVVPEQRKRTQGGLEPLNVGGCSTNEISGIRLAVITKISSQIIVASTRIVKTAEVPTNTLAKALSPGRKGRLASCPT